MAFRDDSDALRAKAEVLEGELQEAHERIAELEPASNERDRLKERVRELEAALGATQPAPPAAPAPPASTPFGDRGPGATRRWIPLAALGVVAAAGAAFYLVGDTVFGPELDGAPTSGMVDLAAHPNPPPLQSETSGDTGASAFDSSCHGYVPDRPQLVLRTRDETTRLHLTTSSDEDTVLVLRTADGVVHCDDDSGGGRNAALDLQVPPGDHRLWVGTYGEGDDAQFLLQITSGAAVGATELGVDADPQAFLQASEEPLVETLRGVVTGTIPADQSRADCRGFLAAAPQLRLELEMPSVVTARTDGASDLVMLVRASDGTIVCDDDSGGGLQPAISDRFAAGPLDLWVGTYTANSTAEYSLVVRALPADAQAEGTWEHPAVGSPDDDTLDDGTLEDGTPRR